MSFDLFESLSQISSGDLQWYDRLSAEDQKAASPFVIARWLTGTSDKAQLIRLNTFVNPYVFSLGQDKALLFKLMAAACTGPKRYNWIKAPGSKGTSKLKLEVIKQFYECSTREAISYSPQITAEDAKEMAEQLGWSKDELAKLHKELDNGSGSGEKPSKVKKKSS